MVEPIGAVSESTVDLTEASLLKAMEALKGMGVAPFAVKPTHHIVPPWVMREIVDQYGEATQENFHRWNCKRLGLR